MIGGSTKEKDLKRMRRLRRAMLEQAVNPWR
jgi:hypothetical protein